eukprot:gene3232-2214_t
MQIKVDWVCVWVVVVSYVICRKKCLFPKWGFSKFVFMGNWLHLYLFWIRLRYVLTCLILLLDSVLTCLPNEIVNFTPMMTGRCRAFITCCFHCGDRLLARWLNRHYVARWYTCGFMVQKTLSGCFCFCNLVNGQSSSIDLMYSCKVLADAGIMFVYDMLTPICGLVLVKRVTRLECLYLVRDWLYKAMFELICLWDYFTFVSFYNSELTYGPVSYTFRLPLLLIAMEYACVKWARVLGADLAVLLFLCYVSAHDCVGLIVMDMLTCLLRWDRIY